MSMFPIVAVHSIHIEEANELLVLWQHSLGACHRPFEQRADAMVVDGHIVGVTVSASTVSSTCGGMPRCELVELARIARHPDHRWVLRPLLRIWREVLAPQWQTNPVLAAVSYAVPGATGTLNRFDGWERVGKVKPSGGGGTWSRPPKVNGIGDGDKTLWRWKYAS